MDTHAVSSSLKRHGVYHFFYVRSRNTATHPPAMQCSHSSTPYGGDMWTVGLVSVGSFAGIETSEQPLDWNCVVLAPPSSNYQILDVHLHCLIDIFILSYYYIYNNFFSVIYWTE